MTSPAKQILRQVGLRSTAAAVDVFDFFLENKDECFSHGQLLCRLEDSGHEINRVTLYRMLERLEDAQLIHRFVDERRVSRYGTMNKDAASSRFICTSCHRQTLIPRVEGEQNKLVKDIEQECAASGKRYSQIQLSVYGICEKCVSR